MPSGCYPCICFVAAVLLLHVFGNCRAYYNNPLFIRKLFSFMLVIFLYLIQYIILFYKVSRKSPPIEIFVVQHSKMEWYRCLNPANSIFMQRPHHPYYSFLPVAAMAY